MRPPCVRREIHHQSIHKNNPSVQSFNPNEMPVNFDSVQAGLYTCLLPSLFFTYLGQAAYLIRFPDGVQSVYYNSLPDPVYWPMFVIATLASIVASQVRSLHNCNA